MLVSAASTSLPLLFSSYLTLVLFSSPCSLLHLSFYLNLSGRTGRNCLLSPPILSGYNWSSDTRFSQGTMRQMSWPDRERYSCPLQSLVVSFCLSTTSGPSFGMLPGFWGSMVFRHAPIPRKNLGINNHDEPKMKKNYVTFFKSFDNITNTSLNYLKILCHDMVDLLHCKRTNITDTNWNNYPKLAESKKQDNALMGQHKNVITGYSSHATQNFVAIKNLKFFNGLGTAST